MKIAAVIAEYNPFHNGHAYQLRRIREEYGFDYIIVVMSGDFTQRGTPAIAGKYTRTRMALVGGADLVVELPSYYACGSAEYFATGAVSLLDGLGCVDALFFGAEIPAGDTESDGSSPSLPSFFMKAADILLKEPDIYRSALSRSLKSGGSFARARMDGLCAALQTGGEMQARCLFAAEGADNGAYRSFPVGSQDSSALSSLLSMPNNTLGIEYCKAIVRIKSPIKPFAIRRVGSGYHDTGLPASSGYAGAGAIRAFLLNRTPHPAGHILKTLSGLVPQDAAQTLASLYEKKELISQDDFISLLHYQLLMNESHLDDYADCTPELAGRIREALFPFSGNGLETFIKTISAKSYPYSRVSRALTHILLGMTAENLRAFTSGTPFLTHARILGFRRRASGTLLSAVKNNARIPFIAKPSAYRPEGAAAALYEADLLASHIYQSVAAAKTGSPNAHELTRTPVIL